MNRGPLLLENMTSIIYQLVFRINRPLDQVIVPILAKICDKRAEIDCDLLCITEIIIIMIRYGFHENKCMCVLCTLNNVYGIQQGIQSVH